MDLAGEEESVDSSSPTWEEPGSEPEATQDMTRTNDSALSSTSQCKVVQQHGRSKPAPRI